MPDIIGKLDSSSRMYCTVADISTRDDLKNLPKLDLSKLIRACTSKIETYTNRVFMRVPHNTGFETRDFLGVGLVMLEVDDLLEINTVTCDDVAIDIADIVLMPYGKKPTTWLEYEDSNKTFDKRTKWQIDGVWGYSLAVPNDIWDACVEYVVWSLGRARQGYQDSSANANTGEVTFASAMPSSVKQKLSNKRRYNV